MSFNITPEMQMGLLQAGLGMMANSSGPNARNAVGLGLLQGLQGYQNAVAQKRSRTIEDEQLAAQKQLQEQQMKLGQMRMDQMQLGMNQAQREYAQQQSQRDAMEGIFTPSQMTFEGGKMLTDENVPPSTLGDAYTRMLQSGNPDLIMMALKGQQKLKQAQMARRPTSNIVGSPIKLGSGNIGYMDRSGNVVDSGQQFYDPFKVIDAGGVPSLVSTRTGQGFDINMAGQAMLQAGVQPTAQPAGQVPISLRQPITAQTVAENEAAITRAKEDAKNEAAREADLVINADLAQSGLATVDYIEELGSYASDAQLGPIANLFPNMTKTTQLLEQNINSLLKFVRQDLGPGVLSNTDILLLQKMLPHMGMDKPAFMEAVGKFREQLVRTIEKVNKRGPLKDLPDPLGIR